MNKKFILVKGTLTQIQTKVNQWSSTGYTVEIAGPLVKRGETGEIWILPVWRKEATNE